MPKITMQRYRRTSNYHVLNIMLIEHTTNTKNATG